MQQAPVGDVSAYCAVVDAMQVGLTRLARTGSQGSSGVRAGSCSAGWGTKERRRIWRCGEGVQFDIYAA